MKIKQGENKVKPTKKGSKIYPDVIHKDGGIYNRLMFEGERKAWYSHWDRKGRFNAFIVFKGKDILKKFTALGSYYIKAFNASEKMYDEL